MHCAFHSSIRYHAEYAGFEPSIESCHRLILVNQFGTSQDSIVCASSLKIEPYFKDLQKAKTNVRSSQK